MTCVSSIPARGIEPASQFFQKTIEGSASDSQIDKTCNDSLAMRCEGSRKEARQGIENVEQGGEILPRRVSSSRLHRLNPCYNNDKIFIAVGSPMCNEFRADRDRKLWSKLSRYVGVTNRKRKKCRDKKHCFMIDEIFLRDSITMTSQPSQEKTPNP